MQKLGKLLIVIGILVLLTTFVGNSYVEYQQKKMVSIYKSIEVQHSDRTTISEDVGIPVEGISSPLIFEEMELGDMIGIIKIPAIDVEIPIIEGDGKEQLKLGAGHIVGTGLPGEIGNCAIAGHRSYTFGRFFNRLNEVVLGDDIIISRYDQEWTYRVDEIRIVEPQEVWVIDPVEDRRIVTLITCEPIVRATHRLIVRGSLLEKEEVRE
ncbi:MAG: class D sortase [Cellulosilyticaceae bacterium]